jgi:hypothetical protein
VVDTVTLESTNVEAVACEAPTNANWSVWTFAVCAAAP